MSRKDGIKAKMPCLAIQQGLITIIININIYIPAKTEQLKAFVVDFIHMIKALI